MHGKWLTDEYKQVHEWAFQHDHELCALCMAINMSEGRPADQALHVTVSLHKSNCERFCKRAVSASMHAAFMLQLFMDI